MSRSETRTGLAWLLLFFKGMAMGAADAVPGVSGGTIAFITNIYEELIHSLRAVNPLALRVLFSEGIVAFWRHINGNFLVVLLSGIVFSLLLFAHSVVYLLEYYPQYVRALFCGLVLASSWYVWRQINAWQWLSLLLMLAGMLLTLALAFLPQSQGNTSLWYYFFCGAVAICAMILPGISGAFILLLLGVYEPVLAALRAMDIAVILVFAGGCACGLMSFAQLLSWLFRHYHAQTLSCLLGVLLGSLYKLWPWQQEILSEADAAGETMSVLSRAVLPGHYEQLSAQSAGLGLCLLLALAGFLLVLALERFSRLAIE